MENYYNILGVDSSANIEDIKKKYRELAKLHHPDKGGDPEKFKKINEAYETLGDSDKKIKYDNKLNNKFDSFGSNPFGGNGYGNPFKDFGFDKFDMSDFLRNSGFMFEELNIEAHVHISLEEIYNNTVKNVTYTRDVGCTTCNGSGYVMMNNSVTCSHCNGLGQTKFGNKIIGCNNCNGTGKISKNVCSDCHGSKIKSVKETVSLNNLFAVGDSVRQVIYEGYGNLSKRQKNKIGNLIVILIPIASDKWERSGFDLYYKMDLDFKTAILGGNIDYTHIDGKTYTITINEKTNNNSKLKLKSKGLLIDNNGNRGNLYIDVKLYINYSKLTENDISILKTLS